MLRLCATLLLVSVYFARLPVSAQTTSGAVQSPVGVYVPQPQPVALGGDTPPTTVSTQAQTTGANAPLNGASAPATYQLQAGDSLGVVYRYTPEYNQTVSVQPDGTVTLQLLGALQVRGLTVDEARLAIHDAAAKRLRDPEVSLELKDWNRPHFTVLGEVGLPGRFELRGPLSVEDALAMAGGVKVTGRRTNIVLIHRVNDTVGQTQLVDLRTLEKNPKPGTELLALQPGDIVVVPLSKLTKVERYVRLVNFGLGSYIPL